MIAPKLTNCAFRAHTVRMNWARVAKGMAVLGLFPIAGCIQLDAPTEPIVIELNINITQEVIYRLADDAENTIEENADIF